MSYLEKYFTWLAKQNKEDLFKTTMNRFRTQSLFLEYNKTENEQPFLTTKTRHYKKDGKEYWSLPLLYRELSDPTEYFVGEKLLYNHEHWCRLIETRCFKPFINKMREDLEMKLRAEALDSIKYLAKNGNGSTGLNAAKFILERGWLSKEEQKTRLAEKRDKKFKEAVEGELNEDFKLIEILNGQASAN